MGNAVALACEAWRRAAQKGARGGGQRACAAQPPPLAALIPRRFAGASSEMYLPSVPQTYGGPKRQLFDRSV